jgi:aminoglycoside phosphotransferase (APT) family kinase protein
LHLIDAGCKDLRLHALLELVEPFFHSAAGWMDEQTKPTPAPLTREELQRLSEEIASSIKELQQSAPPNALGHLDFNPRNILVGRARCTFLDWAEAYVGHPFFTFQYLLEQFRSLCGTDAPPQSALVASYISPWRHFVSSAEIAHDLALMPLLALFAYATAAPWREPEIQKRPAIAAYLRSYLRRMHREAQHLRERRLTCAR